MGLLTRTVTLTNFLIASSALGFQVFVLYPWHKDLDAGFDELKKEHVRVLGTVRGGPSFGRERNAARAANEPVQAKEAGPLQAASLYAKYAFAGAFCCSFTHAVLTPVDVVKTRIQLEPLKYDRGISGTARQIVTAEGGSALLTGLGPTVVGYCLQGAFKFGGYEFFKQRAVDYLGYDTAAANRNAVYLASSAAAEFLGDIALCPFEATRIRLVSEPTFARNFVGAFTKIAKQEGVTGFYSGLGPIVLKQVPYTAATFLVYEKAIQVAYSIFDRSTLSSAGMTGINLGSGLVAGIAAAIVSHPADTLLSKINKEKSNPGESTIRRLVRIATGLGLRGSFTGLHARIVMVGGMTAVQFAIYGDIKRVFGATNGVELKMLRQVADARIPSQPEYLGLGSAAGMDLDVLKELRHQWTTTFDWNKEQTKMNQYSHYTVEIESLNIHFIHEKSTDPDAIPLILNHGWPGSFLEFLPVITPLTQPANTSAGKPVSFHVVVPSLPGFAFSSAPPANWTVDDTARAFNTLMTDILGYKTYATHGTDWGSAVAYSLYDGFNDTVRAGHFTFLPFAPPTADQIAAANISLSPLEEAEEATTTDYIGSGIGYNVEQSTKPNTLGLALQDNPIGLLSWIGEKYIAWSDPRAGTGPSKLDYNEILTEVSLYYLTRSFLSSVFIYFQNPTAFSTEYTKARTDAPMLFSEFKYNPGFFPAAFVDKTGNLVSYKNHDFGGHFAGLDNPPALIEGIREIATHWT